jgi:hypothetical protein
MSSATTTSTGSTKQGCIEFSKLFQHPLLEEPPTGSASAEQRRQHRMLTRKAENICRECPLLTSCLYNAVVKYDVAGFVAATTARQRLEIRTNLGITVAPEDFDTLAGVTARHRQIDHEEVVRLRYANPHESLETLAHRLGCSLSTVKRHLRRHRNETGRTRTTQQPLPSMHTVYVAFRQVVSPVSANRAA